MEQIFNPPVDTAWFQAELDRATRDRHPPMRIVWAPRLTVARVVSPDGTTRDYAKYPILFGQFGEFLRGYYYLRAVDGKVVTVAYQKIDDEIVPPGVLTTDWAWPDLAYENCSVHNFVIERRLPDDFARATHEQKREMARNHLGIDIFGPFPDEGIWDWFDDIVEHRDGCCDLAATNGLRCVGLYREPNHDDLLRVRQAIKEWIGRPKLKNPDLAAELAGQVRTKEILDAKEDALLETLQEVRECENLDRIAHRRSRVSIGVNPPIHRKPY